MLLGFLAGGACGVFNGLLGGLLQTAGLHRHPGHAADLPRHLLHHHRGYPISGLGEDFLWIGQEYLFGVPIAIYAMAIIILLFAIFRNKTTTGRRIFAMGGNEEATRISGINTKPAEDPLLPAQRHYGGLRRHHERLQAGRVAAHRRHRL